MKIAQLKISFYTDNHISFLTSLLSMPFDPFCKDEPYLFFSRLGDFSNPLESSKIWYLLTYPFIRLPPPYLGSE